MMVPEAGPPRRNVQATSVALDAEFHEELQQEPITQPEVLPRERRGARRLAAGERWIARMLRTGAITSGAMFVTSLGLELLPRDESVHVAIDLLRKGAASMLLVTPVARLAMAGTLLGLRGEWRYAAIAAGVIGLLALAVGAGFQA
ncbi:hypothetical protein D7Y27_37495 [Corallococcus sp. AB004]|nr:hypothetical protein [Corallococcus exiguus]NPD23329.1 hypothetical protein [Corallococcus exiguus]NRD49680.1 hypothetical protein [Corallococcus exiguus]RKH98280.1 hypothetical protein D7Y04_24220 [Corallococcus sp. AB038B]RKI31526.1 hypothetical protein D7Y27_37495 [Corallococcus sp. AB004]